MQPCLCGDMLCSTYSIDIIVYVTSAEHIKSSINDDFYRAVFGVA